MQARTERVYCIAAQHDAPEHKDEVQKDISLNIWSFEPSFWIPHTATFSDYAAAVKQLNLS